MTASAAPALAIAAQARAADGSSPLSAAHETVLTTVSVRGLEVQADIGVNMEEIGRRQPLIIAATLTIRPVRADRLDATIDYREVVGHAEALAAERTELIEQFARRLAEACLRHPAVLEADIQIQKPAALPQGMAGTRVVLKRRTGSLTAPV